MLQNGETLHLAGRERGHAAFGIASASGQHLIAEGVQLAVDADDVGDGRVAQIARQLREAGELLVGLGCNAVGGVTGERRLGQLGNHVGLLRVALA